MPATVPESVLKKRASLAELQAKREATAKEVAIKRKESRKKSFKRAEAYVQEYKTVENELVRMRREARKDGDIFVEPESKVYIVVRIRGIIGNNPKVRKILQLLRLRQLHNCVFVRVNKATVNMLRLVEPYVMYGEPTLKTAKQLVYKRGFMKVNKQRVPIAENSTIEQVLGSKDIICVEDLVHELYTVGPHFKEASNSLWPLKLSSPSKGFKNKLTHYNEGGDAGNRGASINEIVQRMI